MRPRRLPVEVSFAIPGAKERADREVFVKGDEIALSAIESTPHGVRPNNLEDIASHRRIPQSLGSREIFITADRTELWTMLRKMFAKFVLIIEPKLWP